MLIPLATRVRLFEAGHSGFVSRAVSGGNGWLIAILRYGFDFFVSLGASPVYLFQVRYSPRAWRESDCAFGYRGDNFSTSEFD